MLTFNFEQDSEFSDPYYNIHDGLFYHGYIGFYDGKWAAWMYLGEKYSPDKLREIADKVDELNHSLRDNCWFKCR